MQDKVLDKINETIGIVKFDDIKILIDKMILIQITRLS